MLACTTAPERAARATRKPLGTRTRSFTHASKAFEADWNPDEQLALHHEICARLEQIELLLLSR